MRRVLRVIALGVGMVAWVLPFTTAVPATLQQPLRTTVDATQIALPVIPPGNVIFRVNGTRALTQRVFPALANASGALRQDIDRVPLVDAETTIGDGALRTGVRVKTWLSGVRLRIDVGPDDWIATLRNAASQRARMDSIFSFTDASVGLRIHVQTSPITPLDARIPDWIRAKANMNETFDVRLEGFGSALDVVLKRNGNSVVIDEVERFQLYVVGVSVSDSIGLTDVANAVLGFDGMFDVVGASSANHAATQLVNRVLREDLGLEQVIEDLVNDALRTFQVQQFLDQELAIGSGALLLLEPSFVRLASGSTAGGGSGSGWLTTEWSLGLDAKPDDEVPGLERRRGLVPAEAPSATPPAGDLQVFVPYSLVEHTLYELIQAGLLTDFEVPPASAGGVGNGFRAQVVPTETPRLRRDENGSAQLVLEFAARLDDAVVGSTTLAPPVTDAPARVPIMRQPLSVSTVNATATVRVFLNLIVTAASGVALDVTSVRLDDLAGDLRVATVTTPLAPHRAALQNLLTAAVRNRTPPQPLIARSIGIAPSLRAVVRQPSYGPVYIRLPIDIVQR